MSDRHTDPGLTHLDSSGAAHMVDVSGKPVTVREAEARGKVCMQPSTLRLIKDNASAKGDVLSTARVAAIMAAKRTSELIPLCHSLPLDAVDVQFELEEEEAAVEIVARVNAEHRTGVEMEAMTAVAVAGLTIYDMCKAVDRGMSIREIRLTFKAGGRSGTYRAE